MRRGTVRLALLALLLLAIPSSSFAQSGAGDRPAAATQQAEATQPGLVARALAAIVSEQRQFHRKLAASLETIRKERSAAAAWGLIVISFLYGVFHAAGPGHGKAILTAYLSTHRERLRRGILLSAAAATVQGLTAILLVFGLTTLAGWAARDTQSAVRWAEQISFVLVAALGGYLVFRAAAGLRRSLAGRAAHAHGPHAHADDGHSHDHCGHTHLPVPDQMDSARDMRAMAGVVLSIGIRPCSGAVLVLAVANLFGIAWAGIAAVFAMSLGTAIAVATLALLVLSARNLVAALVATESRTAVVGGQIVALAGGTIILALGGMLFVGSLGPAHPLGM
jgi:ABC-type nickel/cobalt efflux system permease component RcnA